MFEQRARTGVGAPGVGARRGRAGTGSSMSARHAVVHGTVQGVFYRASAEQEAHRLGVAGWVRNRQDGSVELVVEGDDAAVEQMLEWAGRGPSPGGGDRRRRRGVR